MVTRKNYQSKEVRAAHAVLLELTHLLGEYRNDIVLVGGWVPELLLPNSKEPHVGSTDVDLALNHKQLQEAGYRTIYELLLGRGYRQGKQPFIFHRMVDLKDGNKVEVQVIAMKERLKEKDAWDVYYCVKNYPGGVNSLVNEFKPHLRHGVVQEGLAIFAEKFSSTEHVGCRFVADFEEYNDPEEIALLKRDVFEQIDHFLKALGR